MKCTTCSNFRTRLGPHNDVNEQWCSKCRSIQPELWIQNKTQQCRHCWNKELQGKKKIVKPKADAFAETETTYIDTSSIFKYECQFCGVEERDWLDLGNDTSQCQTCRVVGTNSGYEPCPCCKEQDYLFIMSDMKKCWTCWNTEEKEGAEEQ